MTRPKRNYHPENLERVRELRANMSKAERLLWTQIRREALGFKFRRQYPVGPYALDFYCAETRLCIEVDGDFHEHRQMRDRIRDDYLAEVGIRTLRFASDSLYVDIGRVLYRIRQACLSAEARRDAAKPPPRPSPSGEGEGEY